MTEDIICQACATQSSAIQIIGSDITEEGERKFYVLFDQEPNPDEVPAEFLDQQFPDVLREYCRSEQLNYPFAPLSDEQAIMAVDFERLLSYRVRCFGRSRTVELLVKSRSKTYLQAEWIELKLIPLPLVLMFLQRHQINANLLGLFNQEQIPLCPPRERMARDKLVTNFQKRTEATPRKTAFLLPKLNKSLEKGLVLYVASRAVVPHVRPSLIVDEAAKLSTWQNSLCQLDCQVIAFPHEKEDQDIVSVLELPPPPSGRTSNIDVLLMTIHQGEDSNLRFGASHSWDVLVVLGSQSNQCAKNLQRCQIRRTYLSQKEVVEAPDSAATPSPADSSSPVGGATLIRRPTRRSSGSSVVQSDSSTEKRAAVDPSPSSSANTRPSTLPPEQAPTQKADIPTTAPAVAPVETPPPQPQRGNSPAIVPATSQTPDPAVELRPEIAAPSVVEPTASPVEALLSPPAATAIAKPADTPAVSAVNEGPSDVNGVQPTHNGMLMIRCPLSWSQETQYSDALRAQSAATSMVKHSSFLPTLYQMSNWPSSDSGKLLVLKELLRKLKNKKVILAVAPMADLDALHKFLDALRLRTYSTFLKRQGQELDTFGLEMLLKTHDAILLSLETLPSDSAMRAVDYVILLNIDLDGLSTPAYQRMLTAPSELRQKFIQLVSGNTIEELLLAYCSQIHPSTLLELEDFASHEKDFSQHEKLVSEMVSAFAKLRRNLGSVKTIPFQFAGGKLSPCEVDLIRSCKQQDAELSPLDLELLLTHPVHARFEGNVRPLTLQVRANFPRAHTQGLFDNLL